MCLSIHASCFLSCRTWICPGWLRDSCDWLCVNTITLSTVTSKQSSSFDKNVKQEIRTVNFQFLYLSVFWTCSIKLQFIYDQRSCYNCSATSQSSLKQIHACSVRAYSNLYLSCKQLLRILSMQQHVGWGSCVVLVHETWTCLSRFLITCFGWYFSIGSSTHLWTSQLSCCALVTDSFTKTGGKFLSVLFVIFMRCGGLCSNTFSE